MLLLNTSLNSVITNNSNIMHKSTIYLEGNPVLHNNMHPGQLITNIRHNGLFLMSECSLLAYSNYRDISFSLLCMHCHQLAKITDTTGKL